MFRENIFKGSEQQGPPSNNKKGPGGKGKKKH